MPKYRLELPLHKYAPKPKEVHPKTHPHVFDFIDNVAKELGIERPKVSIIPHPIPPGNGEYIPVHGPNAFVTDNHHIFFTQELLDHVGNPELAKPLTDDLKGVIAHEMHHLKNMGQLKAMRFIPGVVALSAVAGYYLYRRAHEHAEEQGKSAPTIGDVDAVTRQEIQSIPSNHEHRGFLENVYTGGKYVATWMTGSAAGLLLWGAAQKQHEFMADKFASEFIEDKGAFIKMMKECEETFMNYVEHSDRPQLTKIIAKISRHISSSAHPGLESRAANIGVHL